MPSKFVEEKDVQIIQNQGSSEDLTGQVFDSGIEVLGLCKVDKYRSKHWYFKCKCGRIFTSRARTARKMKACSLCSDKNRGKRRRERHIGKKFGRLLVLDVIPNNTGIEGRTETYCFCKCECYNFTLCQTGSLIHGQIKSCGCYNLEVLEKISVKSTEMIGKLFGKLTPIERVKSDTRFSKYRCKCECGNFTIKRGQDLREGSVQSCGCLKGHSRNHKRGTEHYRYNSVITDEERLERRDICRLQIIYRKAKKRDSKCCQKCGNNKTLQVHHIFNFEDFKFDELQYGEENLITLCKQCHKDYHKMYGRKNNTKFEICEFLGRDLHYNYESLYKYMWADASNSC